jgi:hypothetical protein
VSVTPLQLLTVCFVVLNRVQPEPSDKIYIPVFSILCIIEYAYLLRSKP